MNPVMVYRLHHLAAGVQQKIILFFCLHSWGGGGIYYSPVNCGSMVGLP